MSETTTVPSTPHTGGTLSDLVKLVSGTTGVQLISLIVAPILTRLYAPEAYGHLALFVSGVSLLGIIACMRYELAIPLPADEDNARTLFAISVGFVMMMTVILAAITSAFGTQIVTVFKSEALQPYLLNMPVFLAATGLYSAFSYWSTRKHHFGYISIAALAGAVTTAAYKLIAGALGMTYGGSLIQASTIGIVIQATILGLLIRTDFQPLSIDSLSISQIRSQMRRYRKFPLIDSWGALLNNASWQVPPLLFALFFHPAAVGFYALAFRFIQLPMALIGGAVGQVTYPRLARAYVENLSLDTIVLPMIRRLSLLAVLPSFLFLAAGPTLFATVFGTVWTESGHYAQILSVWVLVWFIASPLSLIFNALERQGLLLVFHAFIFVTRLLSILLGSYMQDIRMALLLFSLTGVLVYGGLILTGLRMAKVSIPAALREMRPAFLAGTPCAFTVFLVANFSKSNPLTCLTAALSLCIYIIFCLHSDPELKKYFKLKTKDKNI